ncbi:hypothetical protein P9112_008096 [Eukaryota sp. TZLM1-RC]
MEVANPPSDSISRVRFSPVDPGLLLVSSWDSSVRLYDIDSQSIRSHFVSRGAVLDCCFGHDNHLAAGGLDTNVSVYNSSENVLHNLGSHSAPVSCIDYCPEANVYASGSWDKSVKLWDPRLDSCASTMPTQGKVYAMGVIDHILIVGMSGRHVGYYDFRMMSPIREAESPLKYQVRSIGTSSQSKLYGQGSIEGRVAIEDYSNPSNRFAFKCHRKDQGNDKTFVFPVNSIDFHPVYATTFATGGSDGTVSLWDGQYRRKRSSFKGFNNPISSVSFSCDGNRIAIASSYTFEEGERNVPPSAICIRNVANEHVVPKKK